MIQPKTAQQLLQQVVAHLPSATVSLSQSLDHVLSDAVPAPVDLPLFNQSAMDGYAVRFHPESGKGQIPFDCIGEIKAGDSHYPALAPGQCIRIFTGAMVPEEADNVVIQEKAQLNDRQVFFDAGDLIPRNNIRYKGSQIKKGTVALKAGSLITPGTIGFLASLGIPEVSVIRKPTASILATGNELKPAGSVLLPGEIFESNLQTLQVACLQSGVTVQKALVAEDSEEIIYEALLQMLEDSDLVLISGGISVGDYDFVGAALKRIGVEQLFYKVAQKPGKPLFAGKYGDKFVFALPGNPGSVLTCYYEYVLPAIRRMSGRKDMFLPVRYFPIGESLHNDGDRALFLKATLEDGVVNILDRQGSDMLISFALADALVFIPALTSVAAGEMVETHMLPHVSG
jgi:molybdopterin molybdotransferase